MDDTTRTLIEYRLQRSCEALDEARIMAREGHWNTCVNRLYYACFYAANALLLARGLSSSKHGGVKALFNREWIRPGMVKLEHGRLYNHLFNARQEGDYVDLLRFGEDEVRPMIPLVDDFVSDVSDLVRKEVGK